MNLAVKNCHFIFNGKFYDQVDGVAMGSPLGPLLANIFLSFHEIRWPKDCPVHFKPLHYRHYVNDSFVVFRSRDHIIPFLEYLNSKHPNIKFTYEIEKDHCLPFLDVNIMFSNGIFSTSVYRKPTFTGLFTNFDSFIPISYKRGLINTLLFRYFNISSSYAIFHAEVEKFKKIMNLNGYLEKFFDRIVRSFLNKIFEKPSSTSEPIEPKRIVLFTLPFSGLHSVQIRNQINKLFSSAYPHIQIRCIFRPMQRLSTFFRFKDRIPLSLRSRIVYKYKCQCCNALYVGETVRHFHKRISEHMGISGYTGKPLSKPPFSNIRDHHQSSGHPISPDDFSILSSCSSSFELLLRESLPISKLKPSLNANLSSVPLTLYN